VEAEAQRADPRLAPIRAFYASFATGDFTALKDQLTADVVLRVASAGVVTGRYAGHAGIDAFLDIVIDHTGGMASAVVEDLAIGTTIAFAREIVTLRRRDDPGVEHTYELVVQFWLRDGRISEIRITPEDAQGYGAFYAPLTSH
jgi:ketosteroid isomerase-like protein